MKFGHKKWQLPLWLQAAAESLQNAVIVYVVIALPLYVSSAALTMDHLSDIGNFDGITPLKLSSCLWLLAHAVPLYFTDWTFTFFPWGPALLSVGLAYRSGKRLMSAATEGKIWVAWLVALWVYALFSLLMVWVDDPENVRINVTQALIFPCVLVSVGFACGALEVAGRIERVFGFNPLAELALWRRYVHAVVGGTTIAVLSALAAAAFLVALVLGYHWSSATNMYEQAHLGLVGICLMFIAQLAYLPNMVVWALSWCTHVGFTVGEGSIVSPTESSISSLPLVPLLAALPRDISAWALLGLAVPILAGVLAGWWCWREVPLEFDRELGHQIDSPWIRNGVSALCSSLAVGFFSSISAMVLGWMCSGSAGPERLQYVGVDVLHMGSWFGALVALGVFLGHLLAPWFEALPANEPVIPVAVKGKIKDSQR